MNATAMKQASAIFHKAMWFVVSVFAFLFIVVMIACGCGERCQNCDDTMIGKPGDDIDGVRICDRCADMTMWNCRERMGGKYLTAGMTDAQLVHLYRDEVRTRCVHEKITVLDRVRRVGDSVVVVFKRFVSWFKGVYK